MRNRNLVAIALVGAALVESPTAAQTMPECPSAHSLLSVADIRAGFSRRSVEIVEAALRGDDRSLESLITPEAQFSLWSGDAGTSGGKGIAGAHAFARDLHAAAYQYEVGYAGPISSDACSEQRVTVVFSIAGTSDAYLVDFKFVQGRLVEAVGRHSRVYQGRLANPPIP